MRRRQTPPRSILAYSNRQWKALRYLRSNFSGALINCMVGGHRYCKQSSKDNTVFHAVDLFANQLHARRLNASAKRMHERLVTSKMRPVSAGSDLRSSRALATCTSASQEVRSEAAASRAEMCLGTRKNTFEKQSLQELLEASLK